MGRSPAGEMRLADVSMHLRPCPPVLKTIDYCGVGWVGGGGGHSALRGDSLPLGRVSPGNALP